MASRPTPRRFPLQLLAALLAAAGIAVLLASLLFSQGSALGRRLPTPTIETIAGRCKDSGEVSGTITLRNRDNEKLIDDIPLVLLERIGGELHRVPGGKAVVHVELQRHDTGTFDFGPIDASQVDERAQEIKVSIDRELRPDLPDTKSKAFKPCVPPKKPSPTSTSRKSPTVTRTPKRTATVTRTATQPKRTSTPTITRTGTPNTPTVTVTGTRSPTVTVTGTRSPTVTVTGTRTPSATASATRTSTITPSTTGSVTPSATRTLTPSATGTARTATATASATGTRSPSATATRTVTVTVTGTLPTATRTATGTVPGTATGTLTRTATVTHTRTPTATATGTPTNTAERSPTPTLSATPTQTFFSETQPSTRAPRTPTPFVERLPPSGGGLGGDGAWSPWMLLGLALSAAGAALSLGAHVVTAPAAAGSAPVQDRLRELLGRTGGSPPVRPKTQLGEERAVEPEPEPVAEPSPEPAPVIEAVTLTVSGVESFDSFLDLLRALARTAGVVQARAVGLRRGEGGFALRVEAGPGSDEIARSLAEQLGRAVDVKRAVDGEMRFELLEEG